MIGDVLVLLKDLLNDYLSAGTDPTEPGEDKVVLPDGEKMDPISFKLGAITALLVNLEEESALRAADPYRRTLPDGTVLPVKPEIRLNLYVLFVARFGEYKQGLRNLSLVIRYFQNHRLLDRQNAPNLSADIDKLGIELVTLPFSQQNELWSALRAAYHPSALYKVSLVIIRDAEPTAAPEIREIELREAS